MKPPFSAIVMRLPSFGTPHAMALQASNPELEIHYQDCPEDDPETQWRNGDRNIRNWWLANGDSVTGDQILFLEADVYVNIDLSGVIPHPQLRCGMLAAQIYSPVTHLRAFPPFAEIDRMPRWAQANSRGISPLGCVLLTRAALDAIAAPDHDDLFAADIFSELRLPSLVRYCGFNISIMYLPYCDTAPKSPGPVPGVYHPVKQPVP